MYYILLLLPIIKNKIEVNNLRGSLNSILSKLCSFRKIFLNICKSKTIILIVEKKL